MSYRNEGAVRVIGGIILCDALFLLLLVLKLDHVIDWPWWCVTAPLWAQVAFIFIASVSFIAYLGFIRFSDYLRDRRENR